MSRVFVAASSQFLRRTSTPVTAAPLTIAAWFNTADTSTNQTLVAIEDGSAANRFGLDAGGAVVGKPIRAYTTSASTTNLATTSTTYSGSIWQHGCGVFASASSRSAYLNGGGKVSDTSTNTPTGLNAVAIGATSGGIANFMNGKVAHVGIWSVALDDSEILMLAQGASPLYIRPISLIFYAPLIAGTNPEPDYFKATGLTDSGGSTTSTDNPPVGGSVTNFNNYQFVHASNGISVTESIR